jgi:hypothetical protein
MATDFFQTFKRGGCCDIKRISQLFQRFKTADMLEISKVDKTVNT